MNNFEELVKAKIRLEQRTLELVNDNNEDSVTKKYNELVSSGKAIKEYNSMMTKFKKYLNKPIGVA